LFLLHSLEEPHSKNLTQGKGTQANIHSPTTYKQHNITMSTNTESNFRNAFKNFGARGGVAATDTAASSSGSGGAFNRASDWFGGVRSQVSGYVPVSMGGGAQPQEEDWLGLTWFQVMKPSYSLGISNRCCVSRFLLPFSLSPLLFHRVGDGLVVSRLWSYVLLIIRCTFFV
jgi:hypothetical protein